ncbi:MAG: dTDP-4-dehydrorhamnose 3,5-epimerase family protein [Candidatus Hydrothermarchaeaceae archaeon]
MELIRGVKVRKLKPLCDERGQLMEILRSDWEEFDRFGQVYMTICNPGVAKAWHYHKIQTDHFVCVKGKAKVVLYDNREGSKTKGLINEFIMGGEENILLKIPPRILHGFTPAGDKETAIINVPTELYNYTEPDEYRMPFDSEEIPYDWGVTKGG